MSKYSQFRDNEIHYNCECEQVKALLDFFLISFKIEKTQTNNDKKQCRSNTSECKLGKLSPLQLAGNVPVISAL